MKRLINIHTGDAQDFGIFFGSSNEELSKHLENLGRFANLSLEGRCLIAAVAQRLAIQQPRESVTYDGEIIHATFPVGLLRRAHPSHIAVFLQRQTPDKDILFYEKFFKKVTPVVEGIDWLNTSSDLAVHMEIKADFSDWRLIVELGRDEYRLIYSNGWEVDFRITAGLSSQRPRLPEHSRVYLPFWNTNEVYRYVDYNLEEGVVKIDFHTFDRAPIKEAHHPAMCYRPALERPLRVVESKILNSAEGKQAWR